VTTQVKLAAEGLIDVAVLRRLAREVGMAPSDEYGLQGKDHLDRRLAGYNNAAKREPWVILRDLDRDARCPGELAKSLLLNPSGQMRFRIVVRSIEAWLLADRTKFASTFRVSVSKVPALPQQLGNPKEATLQLLSQSTSRETRSAMTRARPNRALEIGPEYNVRLMDYVERHWRPMIAASKLGDLQRAIERFAELSKRDADD
jgi:hypothetical protein